MGTVRYFEDFRIWQEAMVREVYAFTRGGKDYGFNDQIQRAAVSVMNNIAEGTEAVSVSMFKKFLSIAKGSCAEVRSLLYVASDLNYMEPLKVEELQATFSTLQLFNPSNINDYEQID